MFLFFCLGIFCLQVHGQTTAEWLRQKSTQRKYLLQQIAALQTYSGYLKKGYGIVKDGSGLIKDITGGEFNLHRDYLGSLKNVNPALLKNVKVDAILSMQQAMEQTRYRIRQKTANTAEYKADEIRQIYKLLHGLEEDCSAKMEELLVVISNGKLELTDDERIKRINALHTATQQLYSLHRRMGAMISGMKAHRERELKELQYLLKMQGLQP